MNTKTVKALRKSIGYHPSNKRKYSMENKRCLRVHPEDLRSRYQEMKKELR